MQVVAEIQIELLSNPHGNGRKSVARFEADELIPGRVYRLPTGEPALVAPDGDHKVWSLREIAIYPEAFTGSVCWTCPISMTRS